MNRIREIRIEDRVAVVEPGVVYADPDRALRPTGFFFPPDPASGKVCTLGGNVATDAGGIKGAKYGTTKDYVLGLQVVLPTGEIMRTGSACMKSVSGYDLTHLFVGSEGTLGVITEITLKISPRPLKTATALAAFVDLKDAGEAVADIMSSGIIPSALEVVDRQTLNAIQENTPMELPTAEALLVAETDGYTQEEADFEMEHILTHFRRNRAHVVRKAETPEEAEALWAARKSAYGVSARINTNLFVEDLAVPVSKVPEMLRFIAGLSQKHHLAIPTVGHAGDGNLHPTISVSGEEAGALDRVRMAVEELFQEVIRLGGTLTGEHGIGLAKAAMMPWEHGAEALNLMRSLKALLDPYNILNPGKMSL